jgi:hypothetical protein
VYSVGFSPDGKTPATGGGDMLDGSTGHTIRLWDVSALGESIETFEHRACSIANRNMTPQEWAQYIPGLPYPASQKDQNCPAVATT